SITSRWRILAPPRSTRPISSASRAKSADSMEGTISIICGLIRFYHSGIKTIPGVAARNAPRLARNQFRRNRRSHRLVLFGLERAGRINQDAAGGERGASIREQGALPRLQIVEIGGSQPPFDFGIAAERAGPGARRVHENAIERLREGK